MKLFVGLGNPGEKYQFTRHNAGFIVLEALARFFDNDSWQKDDLLYSRILKIEPKDLLLVQPQTYMNGSGKCVKALIKRFNPDNSIDLIVIHDDLDIPFGSFKINWGKGPKVHNGLASIRQTLGSDNYWHIRVGVQGETYPLIKRSGQSMAEAYLLKSFSQNEKERLPRLLNEISDKLALLLNTKAFDQLPAAR